MNQTITIAGDDWYELISLGDGISLIRERYVADWLRCNIWHIQGKHQDLLIDSGLGLRPLKPEIARLSSRPVIAVMSHCHFDHIGSCHEFDRRLGHHACADVYQDPMPPEMQIDAFVRAETFKALPHDQFEVSSFQITSAPLTGYLDDGDYIDLGNRVLRILHLPGHSPDSIALLDEKNQILFSGDVIYNGDLFDTLYHSNRDAYKESLERLRSIPITTVHGGHDASFDQNRMIEIIDNYLDGGGRLGDPYAWVSARM